jgi:hypothetical protein
LLSHPIVPPVSTPRDRMTDTEGVSMRTRPVAFALLACSCLFLSAAGLAGAAQSPLKASSFKAKAKVTVQPAGAKAPTVELDSIYWGRNEMLRTEATETTSGATFGTIMRDKLIYYWVYGSDQGQKIPGDSKEASESSNFADVARCLAGAKSLGAEEIDGVATEKYRYSKCSGPGTTTMWIAKAGGWPKKMALEKDDMTTTVLFREVETKPLADSDFLPPPKVAFVSVTLNRDAPPKK